MIKFDWPLQKNAIGFDEKLALVKFIKLGPSGKAVSTPYL